MKLQNIVSILLLAGLVQACQTASMVPLRSRAEALSEGSVKVAPADDRTPPLIAAGGTQPMPMPGTINTAGAEDSPFLPLSLFG